jgi:hypothetical protein
MKLQFLFKILMLQALCFQNIKSIYGVGKFTFTYTHQEKPIKILTYDDSYFSVDLNVKDIEGKPIKILKFAVFGNHFEVIYDGYIESDWSKVPGIQARLEKLNGQDLIENSNPVLRKNFLIDAGVIDTLDKSGSLKKKIDESNMNDMKNSEEINVKNSDKDVPQEKITVRQEAVEAMFNFELELDEIFFSQFHIDYEKKSYKRDLKRTFLGKWETAPKNIKKTLSPKGHKSKINLEGSVKHTMRQDLDISVDFRVILFYDKSCEPLLSALENHENILYI